MELVRGDDATLTASQLAALLGVTLASDTFQDGDVLTFTLRTSFGGTQLVTATSTDDGITFTPPSAQCSIAIPAAAWALVAPLTHTLRNCVWDLQRDRSGAITTLLRGELDVLPDVTTA